MLCNNYPSDLSCIDKRTEDLIIAMMAEKFTSFSGEIGKSGSERSYEKDFFSR